MPLFLPDVITVRLDPALQKSLDKWLEQKDAAKQLAELAAQLNSDASGLKQTVDDTPRPPQE